MMNQCLSLMTTAVGAVVGWWNDITTAIPGSVQVITAGFVMFLSVRFFIIPIFGHGLQAGSDLAYTAYKSSKKPRSANYGSSPSSTKRLSSGKRK